MAKPIFVSFHFVRTDGTTGLGYRVIKDEEITKKPIATNEDLIVLREIIKASTPTFKDVYIMNFRRMEAPNG